MLKTGFLIFDKIDQSLPAKKGHLVADVVVNFDGLKDAVQLSHRPDKVLLVAVGTGAKGGENCPFISAGAVALVCLGDAVLKKNFFDKI